MYLNTRLEVFSNTFSKFINVCIPVVDGRQVSSFAQTACARENKIPARYARYNNNCLHTYKTLRINYKNYFFCINMRSYTSEADEDCT